MDPAPAQLVSYLNQNPGVVGIAIALLALVSVLKGFALWRAARNNSPAWFVVLLVVYTLGLLEILYLAVWGRKKN